MQRNKQVAMGRKKFNMDPKKVIKQCIKAFTDLSLCVSFVFETKHLERVCLQGIQFLIENDLLKNTSEDIARFLYKGEGLNKTAIGDYLGERCVWLLVHIRWAR